MKKYLPDSESEVFTHIQSGVDVASKTVTTLEREFESKIKPIRSSVLQKFPILFTLLSTFGVAAVFFAFERILSEISFLNEHPWLILGIGVGTLMFTGVLYKKLGQNS